MVQTLLYTTMLKTSSGWEQALALAADRSGGGVLFHCAQGKDRTGVLAALLQHAVGDSEAQIIADYAMSEVLLKQRPEDGPPPKSSGGDGDGVDWSTLRGSPPMAMKETFDWIRKENGGAIDNFLGRCGCTDAWRQKLLRGLPEL